MIEKNDNEKERTIFPLNYRFHDYSETHEVSTSRARRRLIGVDLAWEDVTFAREEVRHVHRAHRT